MSEAERIKARIEDLLSSILSKKHDANIKITFGGKNNDMDKTRAIREK